MNQIILCIDFSKFTDNVISTGTTLAKAMDSKLCLIHVTRPHIPYGAAETSAEAIRDTIAEQFKEVHEKLQALSHQLCDQGLDSRALLLEGGPIHTVINAEAQKLNADLIIAGTQGHSRIGGLLLGSVCQGLLNELTIPLLVVPDSNK